MQKITYAGYVLEATSFKDKDGKWIGQVAIKPLMIDPMVFDNQRFNSAIDAEDFALDGAQFFIENRLDDIGPAK